jgi:hypothetical protein
VKTYSRIGLLKLQETYSRIGLLELYETYSRIGLFKLYETYSRIGLSKRYIFRKMNFTEIHSPKMIATASEGGSEVFRLHNVHSFRV